MSWTRDFHAVVAGFDHPGPWRSFPVERPTLIGHNDIAPYNACFNGDDLAGVFDWDLAGPTTPLNELAFLAWNCVPLWSDIGAETAARHLALIANTYGGFDGGQVLEAVPDPSRIMLDGIPAAAAAGDTGMANLVAQGEPNDPVVHWPILWPGSPDPSATVVSLDARASSLQGYPAQPNR